MKPLKPLKPPGPPQHAGLTVWRRPPPPRPTTTLWIATVAGPALVTEGAIVGTLAYYYFDDLFLALATTCLLAGLALSAWAGRCWRRMLRR